MEEKGTTKLETRELVEKREELWGKIKEELTPLILKLIKEAEKIKGHMQYWDLHNKFVEEFGFTLSDYERIIGEMKEQGFIEQGWRASIGGFLTTKK